MARLFSGTVLTALVAGFVGGLLAPVVLPGGARSARPMAKKAVKAGLALYDRSRERFTELGETASDLVAEVRAEREEEFRRQQQAQAAANQDMAADPGGDMAADRDFDREAGRERRYDA